MNAFWWIAGASLGFTRDRRLAPPANIAPHLPADLPPLRYKDQCDTLVNRGFVVWDVLHSCKRHGSLDSAIDTTDQQCNDIPELLARFPSITRVCFSSGASTAQSVRLARASFGVRCSIPCTRRSMCPTSHVRAHTHMHNFHLVVSEAPSELAQHDNTPAETCRQSPDRQGVWEAKICQIATIVKCSE
jgi:hypothetical protein